MKEPEFKGKYGEGVEVQRDARWVPVAEMLPEEGENVLLWNGEKYGEVPEYFIGSLRLRHAD